MCRVCWPVPLSIESQLVRMSHQPDDKYVGQIKDEHTPI